MEELKVKNVVISKQIENTENYQKFKEIVKNKKINVIMVGINNLAVQRLQIEKNVYVDVLWPNNDRQIQENGLNNNSIVCKLNYINFSMLFTGDIEEGAEKQILKEYKNNLKVLNSTVLKAAHHGSKTSSTEEFIKVVKPKIAVIGVGKDNKFGHPNKEVVDRFRSINSSIYRTDESGEIILQVNKRGNIRIKEFIKNNEKND